MEKHAASRKIKQYLMLLTLFTLSLTDAAADDSFIDYVTVGVAFPTPTNYEDFDFGVGGYISVGSLTEIGLIELAYFDTTTPAKSDYAHNIEQDRVPGYGPTDYSSRAITGMWGLIAKNSDYLAKVGVGFSYREHRISSPDAEESDRGWGLSYGAGLGMAVSEKNYIVLEYYAIDHLIGTANLGLHLSFY